MKKIILSVTIMMCLCMSSFAQEKYRALNIGLGFGYYGISNAPALHLNYEFDVAKNLTLAPFITFQSRRYYYYGYDRNRGLNRNYYYRDTYVPIGVKGTYYFDELFEAGEMWDFYAAGSIGFALRSRSWEDSDIDQGVVARPSPLYGSLHIGTEVHLSPKAGLFLDVSTGLSTFGLALHL